MGLPRTAHRWLTSVIFPPYIFTVIMLAIRLSFFRYPILFHFIFRTIRRNGIFRRRLPVVGVQRLVNGCGFGFSDAFDLLEILDVRLTHGTNRAEMAQ